MINNTFQTATNFSLTMDSANFASFEMRIVDFTIPAVVVPSVTQATRFLDAKHPGSKAEFQTLAVRAIADGGLNNVASIYNWMIGNVTAGTTTVNDLMVNGYTANDANAFKVRFVNAFPTSINVDQFSSGSADDSLLYFTVEFDYDMYTFE